MSVAAIVLAAGASTRLGQPKQLVQLGGTTDGERLLERAVRVAGEAGCAPVIVVLGAGAQEIERLCHLPGAVLVYNQGWAEGMGLSIHAGMVSLPEDVEGVVLMTCDQPAVTGLHLQELVARGKAGGEPATSAYGGRFGVPAFFPRESFKALESLRGEAGARSLLRTARKINLPGGEIDVDTTQSLELAKQRFAR